MSRPPSQPAGTRTAAPPSTALPSAESQADNRQPATPLFKRLQPYVVITRPEPGASETAARISALGWQPLLAPALRVRPSKPRLPPASSLAAVLVTSSNALGSLPAAYHATPLFAVGDATAERARAGGFSTVQSAGGDAVALAALVTRVQPPRAGPLLLASGYRQGDALAGTLRQAGYRVVRRVVYAMRPMDHLPTEAEAKLRDGQVHAALFFSTETARQFVTLVEHAGLSNSVSAVLAISIGQAAAVALGALRWRGIRIAARPNQDEMLALLR